MAATGFGKSKTTQKPSQNAVKRAKASKQYDKMTADGSPEFNIFIRIQGKKNWYPVGSLAVNRSSKINQAIFAQEAELRQGAFRLFPILRKHQSQLEYGYRLKQFTDESIQIAVKPEPSVGGRLRDSFDQLKARVTGALKQR